MTSDDDVLPLLRYVESSSTPPTSCIASSTLSSQDLALCSRLGPHKVSDIKHQPNPTALPKMYKEAKWIFLDLVKIDTHQVRLYLVEKPSLQGPTYSLLLKSSDWSKEAARPS